MRIGNRAHAEALFNEDTREFSRMSGGGCRQVWTHDTSDVVYKLEYGYMRDQRGYSNYTEHRHARTLRNMSENGWIGSVYIPLTSGYTFGKMLVIAMERIHGEKASFRQEGLSPAHHDSLWELFQLGFGDMHAGNYMWMPGVKVAVAPVDMGSPRYRSNPRMHADTRVISGTKYGQLLADHRNWNYYNREKRAGIAKSCPDGCGLVRWDL